MDKYSSSLDRVVLAVDNSDVGIYELLLPLYFPRTEQEELHAARQLPNCVGGLDGEPLLPDRQIRIIDNPHHLHGMLALRTCCCFFCYYFVYETARDYL